MTRSTTNWDDPASRLALIEQVGHQEYNRLQEKHIKDSTLMMVNGYGIRPVQSRFGRLFMIDGAGVAFSTMKEAQDHANTLERKTA